MATFDKCFYDIPPYQEGNECDFEIGLADNFPLDRVSDITFQAKRPTGSVIMGNKKLSSGEITLTERTVKITFLPADTIGKAGTHIYELEFKNIEGNPFITMGGTLIINRQINTL